MKINRTWIAIMAAGGLLAFGQALMAQNTNTSPSGAPPPVRSHHGFSIDRLAKSLDLTDVQKKKVADIFKNERQKVMGLRDDTSLSPSDRRTKFQSIRTETVAKMKEVLTADQFNKYQKMMPGARPPHHVQPPAGGNAAPANPPQQ